MYLRARLQVLDVDGDHELSVDEFMEGMLQVKASEISRNMFQLQSRTGSGSAARAAGAAVEVIRRRSRCVNCFGRSCWR